jgi:hypothetical protein
MKYTNGVENKKKTAKIGYRKRYEKYCQDQKTYV